MKDPWTVELNISGRLVALPVRFSGFKVRFGKIEPKCGTLAAAINVQ